MKWMVRGIAAILAVVIALVAGPVVLFIMLLASAQASTCAPSTGVAAGTTVVTFDAEQTANAGIIVGVAKAVFVSEDNARRAAVVAVTTALQESGLRNLDHGDQDSVGLFQQRPSQGWGTPEQIMDPAYASGRFYKSLADVPGWQAMPVGEAAQAVQSSRFPAEYAKWEATASQAVDELWELVSPVTVPAAVEWLGEAGSAASEAVSTGGCIASGELVLPLPVGYGMSDTYGWRGLGMGTNAFHRGDDLVADCGTPVFAMMSGRVVTADSLTILIETPGVGKIGYLHTSPRDHLVRVGDTVVAGQQISRVGTQPPSTGCHLDVRVNTAGATDPRVVTLVPLPGAGISWVDPEQFTAAFGVTLCPPESCRRSG